MRAPDNASNSAGTMHTPAFVVMGVCGSGKSTVGVGLAQALGLRYLEGDSFHPPENVARMAAGVALTDDDRQGWLQRLRERLAQAQAAGEGLVLSCSALKRAYRDMLRQGAPGLQLVFLQGSRELLAGRLAARRDHYMPASLLDSQLSTLQAPGDDESPLVFDVALAPEVIVAAVVAAVVAKDSHA